MNYLEFFGLKEDPFKITPDPKYFFPSKSHRDADRLLKFVISSGEGFCVLLGEPGTGKTTVIRRFLEENGENLIYALILTPNLSPDEFLNVVLEELGIEKEFKSKNEALKAFKSFLEEKLKEGNKVLIIVDEAQNLPIETLEELRTLSNLETNSEKLVQIILVGQPELDEKLKLPSLRQLLQRITNKMSLKPLDFEDTKKYINHRLTLAKGNNITFTDKSIKKIFKISKGNPRLINIISSRALMSAFMENSFKIKPHNIDVAVSTIDPEILNLKNYKYIFFKVIIGILIIINIILLSYIIYKTFF
ncbi:MAG: AAA family ATPase [Hydrogenothermus sp.]|nr:MAG: AAA family ATPase [Hydrogenothermus sp.]